MAFHVAAEGTREGGGKPLPYGVGNFDGAVRALGTTLPLRSFGFGLSLLCRPSGWSSHACPEVYEVEAEGAAWRSLIVIAPTGRYDPIS